MRTAPPKTSTPSGIFFGRGRPPSAARPGVLPRHEAALWEKFGAGGGLFRKGELVLGPGMGELGGMYERYVKALAELSRADFDRTRQTADRFNGEEARLKARLILARKVLSDRLGPAATGRARRRRSHPRRHPLHALKPGAAESFILTAGPPAGNLSALFGTPRRFSRRGRSSGAPSHADI
jgi:hypothetical protein